MIAVTENRLIFLFWMLMSVIISTTAVSMLSVTILLDLTTVLVRKDILETDTLAKNLVISVSLVDW